MYCGHARLRVCISVRSRRSTLLHGPGCNSGRGRGCPLVVQYWADLQSAHGLRCYGHIARTLVYLGDVRALLISDRRVTEAFSTLLRRPGLRASNGGVLATLRERKMLASTCLYSLYAWFCPVVSIFFILSSIVFFFLV